MNFFDSLSRKAEQFGKTVENRLLKMGVALKDFNTTTRWWLHLFFLVYAIGLIASGIVGMFFGTYGNALASLCIIVCLWFWGIITVRIAELGLATDALSAVLPEWIRGDIPELNPHPDPDQQRRRADDKKYLETSLFGRTFRAMAMAGMWLVTPLLIPATFPVWYNLPAYLGALAACGLLTYAVASDWNISGYWTRKLRETAVALAIYNLARLFVPVGYDGYLLLGAVVIVYAMARPMIGHHRVLQGDGTYLQMPHRDQKIMTYISDVIMTLIVVATFTGLVFYGSIARIRTANAGAQALEQATAESQARSNKDAVSQFTVFSLQKEALLKKKYENGGLDEADYITLQKIENNIRIIKEDTTLTGGFSPSSMSMPKITFNGFGATSLQNGSTTITLPRLSGPRYYNYDNMVTAISIGMGLAAMYYFVLPAVSGNKKKEGKK